MRKADLLLRYFLARRDVFFVLAGWGKHVTATADDVLGVLRTHCDAGAPETKISIRTKNFDSCTLGRFRVATPSQTVEGKALWACIDFDGAPEDLADPDAHSEPLADPFAAALATRQRLISLQIPSHLEQSGGGYGWHLWILFSEPQTLEDARCLGLGVVPKGLRLRSGAFADPAQNIGIEVFPKTFSCAGPTTGSPIWLPWYHAPKRAGANLFYQVDSAGAPIAYDPEDFATASPAELHTALASLPEADAYKLKKGASNAQKGPSKPRKADAPALTPSEVENASAWKSWRLEMAAAVDLNAVYAPFITGRPRSHGWIECRDFRSTSGDLSPSAGVADGTGEAPRGSFHSFLRGDTLSIFDYLIEFGVVSSFADACKHLADLSGIPLPKTAQTRPGQGDPPDETGSDAPGGSVPGPAGKPLIVVSGQQLDSLASLAWEAIDRTNNPPSLFCRNGRSARLNFSDTGQLPKIEEVDHDSMTGLLARAAQWYREVGAGKTKKLEACFPPKQVASDCLAFVDSRLPRIESVVGCPVFAPDGTLTTQQGYNQNARIWYELTSGFDLPSFPEKPTQAQAQEAADFVATELFFDFPFSSEADKCHAIGALVLALCRRLIKGPTPLHVVEAPSVGAGKSLLARLISVIATGRDGIPQPLPDREEEVRKKLLAELDTGRPIVILDNADLEHRRRIASGNLEAILTSEEWTDRQLSVSKMLTVQNRAVWFMTGVNLEFSQGLMRRRVRIRIDPSCADPWLRGERKPWRHPEIVQWAFDNRGLICSKVYTMVLAWLAAGRPKGLRRLGSFESWSDVIGGILGFCGVQGFLGHIDDPDEAVTSHENTEWAEFVSIWFAEYKITNGVLPVVATQAIGIGPLNDMCERQSLLTEVRGGESARSQQVRFARALNGIRGRVFIVETPSGPISLTVIVRASAHAKALRYWLQATGVKVVQNEIEGSKNSKHTEQSTEQAAVSRDLAGSIRLFRSRRVNPDDDSAF
jgi:hypothetical protein